MSGHAEGVSGLFQTTALVASPFVRFSESGTIDIGKDELNKILQDYARQPEHNKTIREKDKMNKAMIKLFDKPIENKAGNETTYFNCVKTSTDGKCNSTAIAIFNNLLLNQRPRAHPNDISSLAFAFISILSLSLNRIREDPDRPTESLEHNSTSPYFDLSPLYGSNDTETASVRMKDGSGMLSPDCFFEDSLDMLPGAVPALLILWNRFHNQVAKYLSLHDKKDEWQGSLELREGQEPPSQDDQIFNLARSITCINFMNIVQGDVLKSLFGLPFIGPSLEVDLLHDVRGMENVKTGYCSTKESYLLYDFSSLAPPSLTNKSYGKAPEQDPKRRTYMGLRRGENGHFDDSDLARVLFDAIDASAGVPGALSIFERDSERVIRNIEQGRKWKMCTLNEFREFLGLRRLKTFSEWNPNDDVKKAAEDLYKNIDNLELYPGLLAEEPMNGSGFGFGRTMTWGLIVDIITRIRRDPRFTTKFKENRLTKWGYHDCMMAPNVTKFNENAFTAVMAKLLHRTLPNSCPYNNVYFLFPFTIPKAKEENQLPPEQAEVRRSLNFARPNAGKVKVLQTIEAISEVFNDPDKFRTPYKQGFSDLTGRYGYMLGFDDLVLHDRDLVVTVFSLLPDRGAAKRIGEAFAQKAREFIADRSVILSDCDDCSRAKIDIIEDVIDATCISWVCETIYDLDLEPQDQQGKKLSPEQAAKIRNEKRRENERNARQDFAACYAYIFRNSEPEIGLISRERALEASKRLEKHLKNKLGALKSEKSDTNFIKYLINATWSIYKLAMRVKEEYSIAGKKLPQNSAQSFLDRIMKATDLNPLNHVVGNTPHLMELQAEYKKAETGKSDFEARQQLEEQRIIANIIGLSVVISVQFAKVCAQAVDFYLDDKYEKERTEIIELCKDENSSNEKIVGYIREAQRIGQRFGLWRDAHIPTPTPAEIQQGASTSVIIKQGLGYPDVTIDQGDRIFADFSFAHNDPRQFKEPEKVGPARHTKDDNGSQSEGQSKEPEKVDPAPHTEDNNGSQSEGQSKEPEKVASKDNKEGQYRKIGSLMGLGVHKCPAGAFIDETMAGMFRAIFSQEKLTRFKENGHLRTATLHANAPPWDPEIFLDDEVGHSYYPRKLILEYDVVKQKKEPWKFDEGPGFFRLNLTLTAIKLIIALTIFMRYVSFPDFNMSLPFHLPLSPKQMDPECRNVTEIVPYRIESIRPKWFGMFGEPTPIVYHTPRGRMGHKVSIIAIDKRDIQLEYWVDEEYRGTRPIVLDPSVDCGSDPARCLEFGFSAALIYIPPGRHTLKAGIIRNKNENFNWGYKRERRVKMKVDQCL